MAAYVLAQLDVHDPETFKRYREKVAPLVETFGGRYLVRGGEVTTLEGEILGATPGDHRIRRSGGSSALVSFRRVPGNPAPSPEQRQRNRRDCRRRSDSNRHRSTLIAKQILEQRKGYSPSLEAEKDRRPSGLSGLLFIAGRWPVDGALSPIPGAFRQPVEMAIGKRACEHGASIAHDVGRQSELAARLQQSCHVRQGFPD